MAAFFSSVANAVRSMWKGSSRDDDDQGNYRPVTDSTSSRPTSVGGPFAKLETLQRLLQDRQTQLRKNELLTTLAPKVAITETMFRELQYSLNSLSLELHELNHVSPLIKDSLQRSIIGLKIAEMIDTRPREIDVGQLLIDLCFLTYSLNSLTIVPTTGDLEAIYEYLDSLAITLRDWEFDYIHETLCIKAQSRNANSSIQRRVRTLDEVQAL